MIFFLIGVTSGAVSLFRFSPKTVVTFPLGRPTDLTFGGNLKAAMSFRRFFAKSRVDDTASVTSDELDLPAAALDTDTDTTEGDMLGTGLSGFSIVFVKAVTFSMKTSYSAPDNVDARLLKFLVTVAAFLNLDTSSGRLIL